MATAHCTSGRGVILSGVWELGWSIALVLVLYVVARGARRLFRRTPVVQRSQPAVHEFWMWTPKERLPSEHAISNRLMRGNPHNSYGRPALSTDEALLLTDIRTHVGISLPPKNRHLFDPNFYSDEAIVPPEAMDTMREARSMVIVRFVAEEPMPNRDYLHFLTHLADAVADLMGSELIYDREGMRFYTGERWKTEMMSENAKQTFERLIAFDAVEEARGWWLHTHGMRKLGLPDLEMCDVGREQKTICMNILRTFAEQVFDDAAFLTDRELEMFGRSHRLVLAPSERGTRHHRGLVLELMDTTSMIDQMLYEAEPS